MDNKEIIVEFVEGKEAEELSQWMEEKEKARMEKERKRKERRTEINREVAAKKRAKKKENNKQSGLFKDF